MKKKCPFQIARTKNSWETNCIYWCFPHSILTVQSIYSIFISMTFAAALEIFGSYKWII